MFKITGVAEATANLLWEFKIAEKKEDRLTKNKNGKVILVSVIASCIFSGFALNPGAIIDTKKGIKISIVKTITNNQIIRILKMLLAKFCPLFFSFV